MQGITLLRLRPGVHVPGTATTFTDSGLATFTTYTYRVRAHNVAGDSPYSNTASARARR